jgi:hypothetical protein
VGAARLARARSPARVGRARARAIGPRPRRRGVAQRPAGHGRHRRPAARVPATYCRRAPTGGAPPITPVARVAALFWAVLQPRWGFRSHLFGTTVSLEALDWSACRWALCLWMIVPGTIVPFVLARPSPPSSTRVARCR